MSDVSENETTVRLQETEQSSRNASDYLRLLGENLRAARSRHGLTRKVLARDSGVSERFLAQLETGAGNASILVLRQIARALNLPLEAMLPGSDTDADTLAQSIELLRRLAPAQRTEARDYLLQQLTNVDLRKRTERIALIGLRGAGKSTIGKLLADKIGASFFELDRLIEKDTGLSLGMIFDMYGQSGFRRFERRCLDDLLSREQRFVLATGGSLVSEAATYERLLASCYTIWLQARPEDHMSRVVAQGDMRPMAHNPEAMSDLERILAEREPLYRKADTAVSTSGRSVEAILDECHQAVASLAAPEL